MAILKIQHNQYRILDESAQKMNLSVADLVKVCATYLSMEQLPQIFLQEFEADSTEKIVDDFAETGIYKAEFLNELEEALDDSVLNETR